MISDLDFQDSRFKDAYIVWQRFGKKDLLVWTEVLFEPAQRGSSSFGLEVCLEDSLTEGPYYKDIAIIGMSLLQGHPYYRDIPIIRGETPWVRQIGGVLEMA